MFKQPLDTMILVTGGAGLIGSAIVRELNEQGYKNIVIADHLDCGEKWQNLRALQYVDYFEKDEMATMLTQRTLGTRYRFSVIFHLGACSDTTQVDASYLAKNNFEFSRDLADYASKVGARMIYASSAATYGDGEQGFKDDEQGICKLRPLNKYGYSKLMIDQYLLHSCNFERGAVRYVGVKYSNVFGPNEYHKGKMRSMFLRCWEQINATGKVALFKSYRPEYADGEQVRDFLYVKDAAKMTIFFMNDGVECKGLYNIGFGSTRSWNDLAKAMFAAAGKPVQIEYIEMPEELRPRYQYYTCLDISKIRAAGYDAPLMTMEEAAKDYVSYLKRGNAHLGD
jgi:ADP-L-glycero-D-manno-heptose 6-epimerase